MKSLISLASVRVSLTLWCNVTHALPPAERTRRAEPVRGWPFMRFAVWLIERPRWFKRAVLIVNDLLLLSLAVWAAYTLRLSRLYVPDALDKRVVMAAAPIIGVAVFNMRGLYKL